MGSSTRAKESGQAQNVQMGGYSEAEDAQNSLTVHLENIDLNVLNLSSVGDSVHVDDIGVLQVFTLHGRLGEIPSHMAELVRADGFFSGVIIALSTTPLTAVVRLSK